MADHDRNDDPAAASPSAGSAAHDEESGAGRLVCVTGASGYVGSHLVRALLEAGYRVRAAVRDPGDVGKTKHLEQLGTAHGLRLELASADLLRPGSYDQVFEDCVGVFHAASSVRLTAKHPEREIVDPAVKGTKNVLDSCRRAGSVERVVLTSSTAAIADVEQPPSHTFTEADWNDHANLKQPYMLAKTRAERLAWDFVAEQSGDGAFDLVSINPGYVLGPVLAKVHLRSSPSIVRDLLRRAMPACPPLHFNLVDVRDVARAELRAFEQPAAKGRYILSAGGRWMRQMAEIIALRYPDRSVPTAELPKPLMYVAALFDQRLSFDYVRRNMGIVQRIDGGRAPRELDFEYRPLDQSILDTARSIVEGGYAGRGKGR